MKYVVFVLGFICLLAFIFLILDVPPEETTHEEEHQSPEPAPADIRTRVEREPIPPLIQDVPTPEEAPVLTDFGWRIQGTVSSGNNGPIPGAKVSLQYNLDFEADGPAVATVTNESGEYALILGLTDLLVGLLPRDRSCPGTFKARVWAPGHEPVLAFERPGGERLPSPFERHDPIRLDFTLDKGAVVHGRVIDGRGHPVEEACVILEDGDDRKRKGYTYTDLSGEYHIPFTDPGWHFLAAGKFDTGLVRSESIELMPGRDMPMPDLILQGAGALAGRAVYPDGEPAKELELYAYSDRFVGKEMGGFGPDLVVQRCEMGEGLEINWTVTDESGAFRFLGMRPGRYLIGTDFYEMQRVEAPDRFETGRRDIRLVVDIHRLKVILQDGPGRKPHQGSISVDHDQGGVSGTLNVATPNWFQISPGEVIVAARSGDKKVKKAIHVADDDYETVLEIDLEDQPPMGTVLLHVTDRDGTPVPRLTAMFWPLDQRVAVSYPREGLRDANGRYSIPVRAGSFGIQLKVWAVPGTGGHYLPHVIERVDVEENKETPVRVMMHKGGYLKIKVLIPGAASSQLVRARLVGSSERCGFCVVDGEGYTSRNGIVPNVPNFTEEPMMPGPYTLALECDGFESAEMVFEIVPGRTTEREVRLYPE